MAMRFSHAFVNAISVHFYVIIPMAQTHRAAFSRAAMEAGWLKEQLGREGRSQTALAKFLGVDQSAVNRMCKGERQIKANEADKIRAYLAATVRGEHTLSQSGIDDAQIEGAAFIRVEGVIEAGAWREANTSPTGPSRIPVVASAMLEGDVFALRVAGPSMNEFYADGSYVIVRRWEGGALPYGKHVIIQRVRPDGLYECTIKELRATGVGGQPQLWPRSRDPHHQAPIAFDGEDGVQVEILGRVIAGLTFSE